MAFSDLISKPIATPLEGLDKSLATGVELANNQYRNQLAMEQNQMEKEKIQMAYLDKANNLLPNLLKTTGKARSILQGSYMNLMAKGGMPVNQETMDMIAADAEMGPNVEAVLQEGRRLYGNDPMALSAFMAQKLGIPPGDAFAQLSGLQKGQEAAKAAMGRLKYQQEQVTGRQLNSQEVKRQDKAMADVSKVIDDTQKYLQESSNAMTQLEAVFGTKASPKRKISISELNSSMASLARSIGGEKGPLAVDDVKRTVTDTLGLRAEQAVNFFTGKGNVPEDLADKLRDRYDVFKNNLISRTTSKLYDKIQEKQFALGQKDLFSINAEGGKISLGSGAVQLINQANSILKTNRAFKLDQNGKPLGLDIYSWAQKQAAPPTQEQILNKIKSVTASGGLVHFGGLAPVTSGLNVIYAPRVPAVDQDVSGGE